MITWYPRGNAPTRDVADPPSHDVIPFSAEERPRFGTVEWEPFSLRDAGGIVALISSELLANSLRGHSAFCPHEGFALTAQCGGSVLHTCWAGTGHTLLFVGHGCAVRPGRTLESPFSLGAEWAQALPHHPRARPAVPDAAQRWHIGAPSAHPYATKASQPCSLRAAPHM